VQRRNIVRRVGLTARGSRIAHAWGCALSAGLLAFAPAVLATDAAVARAAPDFVLKATDGRNLRLSEYRGDPVVVTFWSSGCGQCRTVLAELDRVAAPASSVLGVSLDGDAQRAASVADSLHLRFPNLVDARQSVARQYDVATLPLTLLIDAQGAVRASWSGKPPPAAELDQRLAALRKE
jgi:peroxiredoxin